MWKGWTWKKLKCKRHATWLSLNWKISSLWAQCFQNDACPCKIRETSSKEYLWASKCFTLRRELLGLCSPLEMQHDRLIVATVSRSLMQKAAVAKSSAWMTLLGFTTFQCLWKAQCQTDLLQPLHRTQQKHERKSRAYPSTQPVEQGRVCSSPARLYLILVEKKKMHVGKSAVVLCQKEQHSAKHCFLHPYQLTSSGGKSRSL